MVRDKEIKPPELQKLLMQYRDKLNEIISTINQIPELEELVWELEEKLEEEVARLRTVERRL